MARNTQIVEIDLKSGITTNESLYSIGSRLWKATNSVWAYRYPLVEDSYSGPWAHRQPQTFYVPAGEVDYVGAKSMRDIAFHHNSLAGASLSHYAKPSITLSGTPTMVNTPPSYTEVTKAVATTNALSPAYLVRFVTAAIGVTTIPAGVWRFYIYGRTSSTTGTNLIKVRAVKRVEQTARTVTFTSPGGEPITDARLCTVTGGATFVAGDADTNRLLAGLVETPSETLWIHTYVSATQVWAVPTQYAWANTTGVTLVAVGYKLFGNTSSEQTSDMTPASTVVLYSLQSTQAAFTGLSTSDRVIFEFFSDVSTGTHTISFYYGGTTHFSYCASPLGAAPYVFVTGANASDQLSYWRSSGGAELIYSSTATRATITAGLKAQGCSAYWSTPGNNPSGGAALPAGVGATIFSHSEIAYVYYILDNVDPTLSTTVHGVRSLTDDVSGCPAGCTAMAIHLDRLWMLTDAVDTPSKLHYTDPLNLDSIRTTNVVQIEGRGVGLLPGQFGTLDNSLTPRLIIFTQTSVSVLDGDPQLGGGLQADLRTLRVGLGLRSPHGACMTPFGAFFLGTDGDLWMIPPGANAVTPVGNGILNRLSINNITNVEDTEAGTIAWYDPYLYIFPGGETGYAIVAEPSTDGIKFWGPVVTQYGARVAIVRSPTTNFASHADDELSVSIHSIDALPVSASDFRYNSLTQHTSRVGAEGTGLGRTSSIQTGLINVPGHAIQLERVILETMRLPATSIPTDPVWTVTATDERGNVATGVLLPETAIAAGAYTQSVTNVQHFVFPPLPAGRGISITIGVTTEAHLGLIRALAEVRTTPAQF